MAVSLCPGETEIDSWTLFYRPPNGDRISGKLVITNRRILFDAKFNASVAAALTNDYVKVDGLLEIDKAHVTGVNVETKLLSKKVHLTLADGSRHTFDRGAMSPDPIVEAIRAR